MRNVIYVVPHPRENSLRFTDAIASLENVRMFLVCLKGSAGENSVRSRFEAILEVDDCFNADQVAEAVAAIERRNGKTHRLVAALEQLQPALAEVRARLGIPGMLPPAMTRFTDKGAMKDALRAAGLPCAKHATLYSPRDAREFALKVGYPVVLKPPVGAGCKSTFIAKSEAELEELLNEFVPSAHNVVQAEEFVHGDEHSFETITVAGKPMMTSLTHYYPAVIEVVRNDWIQYAIVMPREIDTPEYAEIQRVGPQVVTALGMESGYTHMEWFRRPDGTVVIGEIAARPPGVQIVPMMGYAYETDFFRVWARAVVDDAFDGPFERKWAVGVAFLRGQGRGKVERLSGVEEAHCLAGKYVVEAKLPQIGAPKSDHYEGEGHVIVRDKDTRVVAQALKDIITHVKIHYA